MKATCLSFGSLSHKYQGTHNAFFISVPYTGKNFPFVTMHYQSFAIGLFAKAEFMQRIYKFYTHTKVKMLKLRDD